MFIGHIPAGYLVTSALLRARGWAPRGRLMALGLAASVLPDVDLLYFYLFSDRRTVHHAFAPHLPLAWVPPLACAAGALRLARAGHTAWAALAVFTLNLYLHLVLDTVAGGIRWLWPFTDAELVLARVPARFDPWWLNFVLHPSFVLEVALVGAAGWTYLRGRHG